MTFNKEEKIAIAKVGKILVLADGSINENEMAAYDLELKRVGVKDSEELLEVLDGAEALDAAEACLILSKMDDERKKYVTAFLGTLIVIDGEKDPRELAAWGVVTKFCGLPNMSIADAVAYMKAL